MAARSVGKFNISIGMVSLPVSAFVAVDDPGAAVSTKLLHAECGTPHQQKKWCPKCEKNIEQSDLIKGYEYEPGKFLKFTDDEIDSIRADSTSTVPVTFVSEDKVDPLYFRHAYYLRPQSPEGAQAFAYIREAMRGSVAIGVWGNKGREHLIGIRAYGSAMTMHLLHMEDEVRPADSIGGEELLQGIVIDKKQLNLAKSVVAAMTDEDLDLTGFEDAFKAGFMKMKDAKLQGIAFEQAAPKKAADAPLDFMAALEKSLGMGKPAKRKKMVKVVAAPAKKQRKAS
jgi:DNA end-binding protein Ku